MESKKIRTAAGISIALLILMYVAFYFINLQSGNSVKGITTETAMYGEVFDSLQTRGFAIREESIIDQSYSGVVNYRVSNGSRVSEGGVIADIYNSEGDAAAQNRIDRIDSEIASLQALSQPLNYFASTPNAVGSQILDALGSILTDIQRNDFADISRRKEGLLTSLSRKMVISGQESAEDYAQRIEELKAERDSLSASAGEAVDVIEAPNAGYFIGFTDSFESVFDIQDVEKITPAKVEELLSLEHGSGAYSPVGKICGDFKWYLVCEFDDNDMIKFEGVEDVSLDIPFASTETIPAKVVAKNRDSSKAKTAVVLKCSYMDADIATVRNEMIQINVKDYSGVLVSEKALRFQDIEVTEKDENGNTVTKVHENVKGVYVVYGERLEFVQVFTEKNVNGYAVCKTELSEEEQSMLVTERTVQLYDDVVIGGVDLYDGKVIR